MSDSPKRTPKAPSANRETRSKAEGEGDLRQIEREAAMRFFEAKASDWPRDAIQRRMQSSGG